MSRDGQCDGHLFTAPSGMEVCTFPMPAGTVFDWHAHEDHQLAWAVRGVLTVRSGTEAWVLPSTRALWIPAGIRHETLSDGTATMRTAYVRPSSCPVTWTTCTPVVASSLMAELLAYLGADDVQSARRLHAEQVLVDILEPVPAVSFDVRMPTESRAFEVATMLIEHPADPRTLAQFGADVGASGRTLARGFTQGTGLPFARWRALVRLNAAMQALAARDPVSQVARRVGYETTSAFIAAFRRETGITPARYFSDPRH